MDEISGTDQESNKDNKEKELHEMDSTLDEVDETPFPKADLILDVEGKELYVNSQILKQVSPVFRAMLESEFKEKLQERIVLPGKSHKAMVEFLKCTYPFINAPITAKNVLLILPLADEYQTALKEKCEDFILQLLRGNEKYFLHRTDVYDVEVSKPMQTPVSTTIGGFNLGGISHTVAFSGLLTSTDPSSLLAPNTGTAESNDVNCYCNAGFGKEGFAVGNTVPAERVISYVIAAEKFGLKRLLFVAIQYMAMRMFSHYETTTGFTEISPESRMKIMMLRLRIIEHKCHSRNTIIYDLVSRK